MIETLTIEGFKSIRELRDFELRSLNVLIGANGAGKSNLVGGLGEGLLFSDPAALARAIRKPNAARDFQEVRRAFATPEDINDSPGGAPSKRVLRIYPPYQKVIEGTLAAH